MLSGYVYCMLFAAVYAATTTQSPAVTILYDLPHHKAMIVRDDGCYEYNLNHQDRIDAESDTFRPILEARMLSELEMAINIVETGHNHLNHLTEEIRIACAAIPVYSWDIPVTPILV